tara:strand:+ start:4216 stop:4416 length:201 start_codon:yes stop_codon:yes gene_type:complete
MKCMNCGKHPKDLPCYSEMAREMKVTAADYVRSEEGTFNEVTQTFACDDCYILMGCPSSPEGWKAS